MNTLKQRPVTQRTIPTVRKVTGRKNIPLVNIAKDENDYHLYLAIPGVEKDQIELNVKGDLLTISLKNEDPKESNYTRREFDYSSFSRSFTLPEDIDYGKIEATSKDGILHLTLPVRPEEKPRTINIK